MLDNANEFSGVYTLGIQKLLDKLNKIAVANLGRQKK